MTLRHHMSISPSAWGCPDEAGGWRRTGGYECNDCGAVGTREQLAEIDCPNGLAPVYDPDYPKEVRLHEIREEHFVKRFVVWRMDDYTKDANFEKALRLKSEKQRTDVLRRLGAINGCWLAYSLIDDGYIGETNTELVKSFVRRGIVPQLADPEHRACSIGFSEREQKWYGWSHRAMCGFALGHVVGRSNDSGIDDGYLWIGETRVARVGFECKTLDDCKLCATAFADSVS